MAGVDPHAITTMSQLRELYAPPASRSLDKELDRLDDHCRRLIGLSPFVLIASADRGGACDVSPKGGPPGFVTVLDDERVLRAEAMIRSGIWRPDTWSDPDALPSAAEILSDHIGLGDVAASAAALNDSYTNRI
jgi:hypothetical protein